MTVLKRRTRMVNFRLSEDEYTDLRNMCMAKGVRSVSDFARSAVAQLVSETNGSTGMFESTVRQLYGRIEELDREVKRLTGVLEGLYIAASMNKLAANRMVRDPAPRREKD